MSKIDKNIIDEAERRGVSVEQLLDEEYQFWASVNAGTYWQEIPDTELDRLDARNAWEVD